MQLSPFMKQFKKDLEALTKKQLVKRLLISVEMSANQGNEFDMAYEKLGNEKQICEAEIIKTEKSLSDYTELYKWFEKKTKEYESMSVLQFIRHKFK